MQKLLIPTARLLIRHLEIGDLEDFHKYRSNPEVTKYQGFDVMDKDQAEEFILCNSTHFFGTGGEWVQYAIEEKASGRVIGDCAIKLDQDDLRLAQIGITISPEQQRKGYAREVMQGLLDFLFSLEDFHRVTEIVDAENEASIRLLENVGFRREGHFIENIFFKGKWGSEFQYALLKKEWQSLHHTNKSL